MTRFTPPRLASSATAFAFSVLLALPATAQPSRTIVVSPVPGDPVASGTELADALDTLDVSESNPALVRVDPGVFDVRHRELVVRPGVTLEGAGPGSTTIRGLGQDAHGLDRSRGVITGAGRLLLRDFTVECLPDSKVGFSACLTIALTSADATVENLEIHSAGSGHHWGIRAVDTHLSVSESSIFLEGGTENYGIVNATGARATLERVQITSADGTTFNAAVLTRDSGRIDTIDDSELWALGGDRSFGLHQMRTGLSAEPALVTDSSVTARDADLAIAVSGDPISLQARGTSFEGTTSAIEIWTDSWIDLLDSDLSGGNAALVAADLRLVHSRVRSGSVEALVDGTCIATAVEFPAPQFLPTGCPTADSARSARPATFRSRHPGSELDR